MLTDKFFLWPYGTDSLKPAIDEISPLMEKSALAPYCSNGLPYGNLVEFIALVCRSWNINPWWVLVSGQREQGLFNKADFSISAAVAWLGFVGQDIGRASRPGYYGIYTQVERLAEQSAWLLGCEKSEHWPAYVRAGKGTRRWETGLSLTIEKDGKQVPHTCNGSGEYLALSYTPHFKVLETNFLIAQKIVPSRYL